LPPLDLAVAVAKIQVDVVHSRNVDDGECLDSLHRVATALPRWMAKLYDETQTLQRPSFKKHAVPFLHVALVVIVS
jgi:hypothetical protein